jgi:GNAT superfamily N-acetyltransferase
MQMLQDARVWPRARGLREEGGSAGGRKSVATAAGTLFLQDRCPPALVEGLTAASGLRAFARKPEREHALLLGLARRPACRLALAYTPGGEIVGQVTLAPAGDWWEGLAQTYEIAVEVSDGWRQLGVARQLLSLVFERERTECSIILGMGLSWHWDTEGLGISSFRYRQLIERLFAAYGFVEYLTAEENIRMDPANILLARLGRAVDEAALGDFFERLLRSEALPGL